MPAIDYVSIVKAVYEDRRAMVLASIATIIGVAITAAKTGSPLLWALMAGFILVTIYRYVDMTLFERANIGPADVEAASRWETRATWSSAAFAYLGGLWCFISLV